MCAGMDRRSQVSTFVLVRNSSVQRGCHPQSARRSVSFFRVGDVQQYLLAEIAYPVDDSIRNITNLDRVPLVTSAIVNVAQDVDEDWPLEVYDRLGNAVNITMEPGDMVFYESHSLIHGRPFALKGRFYANIFIHFEPFERIREDSEFVSTGELPPYILPGSPEAEFWKKDHPFGWSKYHSEVSPICHQYVQDGLLDNVKELAELDSRLLHLPDEYGWQPVRTIFCLSCMSGDGAT
jgi:hypothetical protein